MGEARVPTWFAATGLQAENERVYRAFQLFLRNLPVSYTRLAEDLGVSQPAVSRWAGDVTHPSLDEMSRAVSVVRERLEECHRQVDYFAEILDLVEEAMRLYDLGLEGRSDPDSRQQHVTERLRTKLDVVA